MDKDFFKKLFNSSNKKFKADIIAIFITGVILLIITSSFFKKEFVEEENKSVIGDEVTETTKESNKYNESDIEKKLSSIISEIEGAGDTKVMITMKTTPKKVIAKDIKEEKSNESRDNSSSEKTIFEENTVSLENKDGRKEPFIISENMPDIEGALIVSKGADNVYIKSAIIEAAQALLGIPSHKIAVFKMK